MQNKIPVAVLGATGSVGQRFVSLLDGHPWFEVRALTGSARSEGKRYADACHWVLPEVMPAWAGDLVLQPSDPDRLGVPLAFSALPTRVAKEIEALFAQAGTLVCSNASAFRREGDVPILLPEINPEHASLLAKQRTQRGWKGGIVTNANCTSTGLAIALNALNEHVSVHQVMAVSMQAISGAGYPGVASLDIVDNVVPFIAGEEEKVAWEPRKIMGKLDGAGISLAAVEISAQCNRVPVSDGHMVSAAVRLERKIDLQDAIEAWQTYQAPPASRDLPSSPRPVIQVMELDGRPQPRLDRMTGNGMTTLVGGIREDTIFDLRFVVLSHNTIRGAAGGSIYNAELLLKHGYLF